MSTIPGIPLVLTALAAASLLPIASTAHGQGSCNNGPGSQPTPGLGQTEANATSVAPLMDAAVDAAGNVYTADCGTHTIRKTSPNGTVTILAGKENVRGNADGTGSSALFNGPQGIAVDASGNLFVADAGNHTIRKINFAGTVTTLAGTPGQPGNADGTGPDARFSSPRGVAVDLRGNVYVADTKNDAIRRISSFGVVTTLAGAGNPGFADGTGRDAKFHSPSRVALDPNGTLYVSDSGNHRVRKISSSGVTTTVAGTTNPQARPGTAGGYADGSAATAQFNCPEGIVVDASGNLFVGDVGNRRIRRVTRAGEVTTVEGTWNSRTHHGEDRRRWRGRGDRDFNSVPAAVIVDRPTGTYIYGGLPSPGDFDMRYGKPIPEQAFGIVRTRPIYGGWEPPRESRRRR